MKSNPLLVRVFRCAVAASLALFAITSHAAFPDKPVTLVVPGPPAGVSDFIARLVAERLSEVWKQPVVVQNRPGASGTLGSKMVRSAPADGYTLLLGHVGSHGIAPTLMKPAPYDPVADFTPVILVATSPEMIVVPGKSAIRSFADLVAQAKARPGQVTYGSPGIGQPMHLIGHRFTQLADVSMNHVPFQGTGPAVIGLVGGHVDSLVISPLAVMAFIKDGRVRAITVNSPARMPELPDVPTAAELGFRELQRVDWFGIFVPVKTPKEVVSQVNSAINKVLAMPDVRARSLAQYLEPVGGTPEHFAAFQKDEVQQWTRIIQQSGLRFE